MPAKSPQSQAAAGAAPVLICNEEFDPEKG
jgi:hypothetical protein